VYWRTLARLLTRPHPSLRARARTLVHVGAGVRAAAVLDGSGVERVHAHFVDRAAIVALTAARLLGVPYSATAHAADIYVSPVLLDEKLHQADFVATCTGYNKSHLEQVVPQLPPGHVARIHHGLDMQRYQPAPDRAAGPPVLLAVGQLKEKKGFTDLIEACRLLRERGRSMSCTIVGEGPLRQQLLDQIRAADLDDVVTLTGALGHDEVIEWYRRAQLFVLPCTTAADGDRDGLPNVILEAMAMALPVVSTTTSAVGEAVEHGRTGLLVPPQDPAALADAIQSLLDDEPGRAGMGRCGRHLVAERFDIERNVARLHERFAACPATR
jgi:glycosyltransferase involved in cell wall biosynthesis